MKEIIFIIRSSLFHSVSEADYWGNKFYTQKMVLEKDFENMWLHNVVKVNRSDMYGVRSRKYTHIINFRHIYLCFVLPPKL